MDLLHFVSAGEFGEFQKGYQFGSDCCFRATETAETEGRVVTTAIGAS